MVHSRCASSARAGYVTSAGRHDSGAPATTVGTASVEAATARGIGLVISITVGFTGDRGEGPAGHAGNRGPECYAASEHAK